MHAGHLDNSTTWDEIVPLMMARGAEAVVCVDMYEHATNNYASHICELVDALGWDNFSVLSHSQGTTVGQLVAAAMPKRIISFVALESHHPCLTDPHG